MKKLFLILGGVLIIIIIAAVVGFYFMMQGPDISQYEYLKQPQISAKADQKMLVVTAIGDPNKVGSAAFEMLFGLYYQAEETEKSFPPPAAIARWPLPLETPKDQWIGHYALPVPQSMNNTPEHEAVEGLTVSLENWTYGDVAEILHIGPYSNEQPTVEKLKAYVTRQGYQISGTHEEEYLKGPSMFGQGDPEEYATIIRYPVKIAELDTLSVN